MTTRRGATVCAWTKSEENIGKNSPKIITFIVKVLHRLFTKCVSALFSNREYKFLLQFQCPSRADYCFKKTRFQRDSESSFVTKHCHKKISNFKKTMTVRICEHSVSK